MHLNILVTLKRSLSLLLLLALTGTASAQVWQLNASDMAALHNQKINQFTFFAVKNGRFEPVPHQWLEMSTAGRPYFSAEPKSRPAGDITRIDPSDKLLLRRKDGGTRLTRRTSEQVIAELRVNTPGEERFFYLVQNAYRQATQRYVKLDAENMTLKSTDYALFFEDNNLLRWGDFFYRSYRNSSGERETLLDTMKIRLSAGIFSENRRITLTNHNLKPHIKEIIEGPLAWGVYASTTLQVAKIPVLHIRNHFLLMPQEIAIYTRFTLPAIAKTVLNTPEMSISLDGNQLYGSKLMTSWTENNVAITDGKLTAKEKAMTKQPMTGKPWLWFGTEHGFNLLAQLDFQGGFDQPVSLIYQDSARLENKPERFTGQLPNVGFAIKDIPMGKEFYFITRLVFSEHSDQQTPAAYASSTLAEPSVTLTAFSL